MSLLIIIYVTGASSAVSRGPLSSLRSGRTSRFKHRANICLFQNINNAFHFGLIMQNNLMPNNYDTAVSGRLRHRGAGTAGAM